MNDHVRAPFHRLLHALRPYRHPLSALLLVLTLMGLYLILLRIAVEK